MYKDLGAFTAPLGVADLIDDRLAIQELVLRMESVMDAERP